MSEAIRQLSSGSPAAVTPQSVLQREPEKTRTPGKKAGRKKNDAATSDDPASALQKDEPAAGPSLPVSAAASAEEKQDLGTTGRQMAKGVFLVGGSAGTGSAWVISKKHRLLVTNAHVADIRHDSGGKMVAVQNGTATFYDVEKVWYHPGVRRFLKGHRLSIRSSDPNDGDTDAWAPDLAILQLSAEGPDLETEFVPATLDELTNLFAQPVAIMGFPGHDTHGLPSQGETAAATFHTGVVSRITDFQFNNGTPAGEHQFVQHTIPTWSGFSGSAIFLANGHVVCVHNSSNFDRRGDEVRSIPHGIRVDCVLEMLVHHKLDDLVSFEFDKDSLLIDRWIEPDARTQQAFAAVAKAQELVDEANTWYQKGDYENAARKCGEALEVLPTYAPAFTRRGAIFYVGWLESNDWETERAMAVLNQRSMIRRARTNWRRVWKSCFSSAAFAMRCAGRRTTCRTVRR
ncbi:MAG: serine protease [Pirellulales bacterium]